MGEVPRSLLHAMKRLILLTTLLSGPVGAVQTFFANDIGRLTWATDEIVHDRRAVHLGQ